jgi:hypothetical protein
LRDRNAPPSFTSDLQRSLMVDSARLQREYWSRNAEDQNKPLSAEFQEGKNPAKTRNGQYSFWTGYHAPWSSRHLFSIRSPQLIVVYSIIEPQLIAGQKIRPGTMLGGLKHFLYFDCHSNSFRFLRRTELVGNEHVSGLQKRRARDQSQALFISDRSPFGGLLCPDDVISSLEELG